MRKITNWWKDRNKPVELTLAEFPTWAQRHHDRTVDHYRASMVSVSIKNGMILPDPWYTRDDVDHAESERDATKTALASAAGDRNALAALSQPYIEAGNIIITDLPSTTTTA